MSTESFWGGPKVAPGTAPTPARSLAQSPREDKGRATGLTSSGFEMVASRPLAYRVSDLPAGLAVRHEGIPSAYVMSASLYMVAQRGDNPWHRN